MSYAHVAVNSPSYSSFCYAIPPHLSVTPGQAVWVPFGPRVIQGVVVGLSQEPSVAVVKEIAEVITAEPLLSATQLELARWISSYYLAPLFSALALMLPPGFERQLITLFRLPSDHSVSSLTPEQAEVVRFIGQKGKASLKELEKKFGIRKARQITAKLVALNAVVRYSELEKARVKAKLVSYIRRTASRDEILDEISRKPRAQRQNEVLRFLSEQDKPLPLSEVREHLD